MIAAAATPIGACGSPTSEGSHHEREGAVSANLGERSRDDAEGPAGLPPREGRPQAPWQGAVRQGPRVDLRVRGHRRRGRGGGEARSEEHTSELQSRLHLVCRLLLEKK